MQNRLLSGKASTVCLFQPTVDSGVDTQMHSMHIGLLTKPCLQMVKTPGQVHAEMSTVLPTILMRPSSSKDLRLSSPLRNEANSPILQEEASLPEDSDTSSDSRPPSPPDSAGLRADAILSCVICRDRQKSRRVHPCGHICVCDTCGAAVSQCPICRGPVERLDVSFF